MVQFQFSVLSPHQRLGISFIPFELIKLTDNKPSRERIYIFHVLHYWSVSNIISSRRVAWSCRRNEIVSLERNVINRENQRIINVFFSENKFTRIWKNKEKSENARMYFYFTFSEDKIAEKISWMKKIVAKMVYNVNLFPFLF